MSILKTTSSNMILQQQQQQQRTKMKTTAVVSFHELVQVNLTLHINDYADDEVESCWFTSTEYNAIRNRIFMTLDMVKLLSSPTHSNLCSNSSSNSNNSTSSSSSSSVCIRGLEQYLSSCFGEQQHQGMKKSTRIRRRHAISAVLHEQDRQQYEIATSNNMFFYDDVKIRDASRNITRSSEDIASVMGQFDHITACTDDGNNSSTATTIKDKNLVGNATNKDEKKWNFNTTTGGQQRVHRQLFGAIPRHHHRQKQ